MFFNKQLQTDFVSRKLLRISGLDKRIPDKADNLLRALPIRNAPLVSVILPVYNHAKFIVGAINSVLSQKVPLELIIVDDGSTDDLEGAVLKFLSNKRVKFVRQDNAGLASALNVGFLRATAPFLTWTSADNLFLPDALSELYQTLSDNPFASLAYGNVQLIDEKGKVIYNSNYRPSDQLGDGLSLTKESRSLFYYDDNFINSCFLYRRSFANLANGYSINLNGVEDYEYWLKLSAFSPAVHTLTNKPLYQYRLHKNSLTEELDSSSLASLTRKVRFAAQENRELVNFSPLPDNLSAAVHKSALNLAPQICRARDCDFKSVPDAGDKINVGIIHNTGNEIKIEKHPGFNFHLYTLDRTETLETLNINGVFIFNDHPQSFTDLPYEEYRSRSLMFFLSRMDYLLLPNRSWSVQELRQKAGLAASSGLELRVLRNEEILEADQEFLDLFLPAKHITFYDSVLEALGDELRFSLSREYFDKWLYSQSYKGISALVKTGILAKKLEISFSYLETK